MCYVPIAMTMSKENLRLKILELDEPDLHGTVAESKMVWQNTLEEDAAWKDTRQSDEISSLNKKTPAVSVRALTYTHDKILS